MRATYRTIAAVAAAMAMASCSMMQDNRDNCPTCKNPLRITLKYDYNLQRADMFNDHVGAATCYIVNPQTNVVVAKQQAANSTAAQPLRDRSFGFNFEGLAPGAYDVYAVGAQRTFSELSTFQPTELEEGDDIRQLRLTINRTAPTSPAAVSGSVAASGSVATPVSGSVNGGIAAVPAVPVPAVALDTIWHGMTATSVILPEKEPKEAIVGLVRDTKNLNIMLVQTQNPTDNYADNYEVYITDNNGLLDYDNSQLPDDDLVYTPYAAWTTETVDDGNSAAAGRHAPGDVIQRTAHFDMSFGRLFNHTDDASKNARLVVNNAQTGENIINVDLAYYLSLVRNAAETSYDVQEFLDRGYDYRLDFILSGNEWQYMTISIAVTGWSLRIQRTTL